ncbi:hypothetical protein DENSPDRAFT_661722 [Dentipellis sp. KUC8613]|nr:hypothetical protein DENSPDRAFT_661722 [Dentipellis sp. KUC8613]
MRLPSITVPRPRVVDSCSRVCNVMPHPAHPSPLHDPAAHTQPFHACTSLSLVHVVTMPLPVPLPPLHDPAGLAYLTCVGYGPWCVSFFASALGIIADIPPRVTLQNGIVFEYLKWSLQYIFNVVSGLF